MASLELQNTCNEIKEICALWTEAPGPVTNVKDLGPTDLVAYLPNIILAEVEEHTHRIRYRHVGNELSGIYGKKVEGKFLDEMPFIVRKFAAPADLATIAQREPRLETFTFLKNLWAVRFQRVMLPLMDPNNERVAEILVAIYPEVATPKKASSERSERRPTHLSSELVPAE